MRNVYTPELQDYMKKNKLGTEYVKKSTRLGMSAQELKGVWKLKKTPLWPLLKPLRMVYRLLLHIWTLCKSSLLAGAIRLNDKKRAYAFSKEYIKSIMPDEQERDKQKATRFEKNVKFSILAPLYNTPEKYLRDMIESVQEQTYENWELCLADGSDEQHNRVGDIVKEYASSDSRIVYKKLEKNRGISENTNVCIDMASGDYIALFDHDDILHPSALYEVMRQICEKDADYIYTDEATFLDEDIYNIVTYHFKPDFAIDNLRANNYICHFSVFSKELLDKTGSFDNRYDGSQDHDIILRLTANAKHIEHIPKLLYFWRSHKNSVSQDINSKTYAIDAGKRAVEAAIKRAGMNAKVESSPAFPTIYKINYEIKKKPKVSVIIPNKDNVRLLANCVDSIIKRTTYEDVELIIVENNSTTPEIFEYYSLIEAIDFIKVIRYEGEFNYSKINNDAVKEAAGEYIIFLNNDIEIITPSWIEEMMMYCQREDVGAVGAKLYYGNNTVQHNGVILNAGPDGIAIHSHAGERIDFVGYMGRMFFAQNVSAVTAACMMIKRDVFLGVGGFDEKLAVAYNDIDLCIKLREKNMLIVINPFIEAYHYESLSRGYEQKRGNQDRFQAEVQYMRDKWKDVLANEDPFYNPNMSKLKPWKFGIEAEEI